MNNSENNIIEIPTVWKKLSAEKKRGIIRGLIQTWVEANSNEDEISQRENLGMLISKAIKWVIQRYKLTPAEIRLLLAEIFREIIRNLIC